MELPRYFFDALDGDRFFLDETGTELPGIEAARALAARSLTQMILDTPASACREVAVEVRDEDDRPLFRTVLWFQELI